MTIEIVTEIEFKATPESVWNVLTDFENYPKWNPFIKSITGEKKEGERIVIDIMPPNRNRMTFSPVLLTVNANKELRWLGSLGFKGIFDGEHYFRILEQENGFIKFEHGEIYSGILVGFMQKLLKDTKLGFEQMNKALKKECETKKKR